MIPFILGLMLGAGSQNPSSPKVEAEETVRYVIKPTGILVDVYGGDCNLFKKFPRTIDKAEFKSSIVIDSCIEIDTYTQGYVHMEYKK